MLEMQVRRFDETSNCATADDFCRGALFFGNVKMFSTWRGEKK
jgi:hypothetical protein